MEKEGGQVLMPVEAEAYVESLEYFDLKDIGSSRWFQQHERIEKLNIQAVLSASVQEDEFVKEFFINHDKVKLLIQDLLTTEVWREKVFAEILDSDFEPKTTFPLYMVLYHEATLVNLLETIMYHRDSCETAEDFINDLVDYCYRKLCLLVSRNPGEDDFEEILKGKQDLTASAPISSMEELEKQEKQLNFDMCVKALSLLRYFTDHLQGLPLSVMSRILNTHDVPNLLVQLVESPPWRRRIKGSKTYKYIDSKWKEIIDEEAFQLTKTEGQVWIALFHLLMDSSCQEKYDLNSYRKNMILKLRAHLTPILIDQLPVLGEMLRYLEQLSMMDPPPAARTLYWNRICVLQVPEIRNSVLKKYEGKWEKLAKEQIKSFFNPSEEEIKEQARRWVDTYSFEVLENLIAEPPKCTVCGEQATKRCSRCQNEWYCRRECQVQHWPKHKKACDLMQDSIKTKNESENVAKSS
ncbi:hypothetical protein C0Q70_14687 [Pomacea canaliculata]|uniref:Zinc finger MYND domain-containing protein 10 n=1 Tax=Pomacea canaliculata TaxID=400727 RepID=A0A2T7NSQ5_POMCA|nr:hypothetical protein C0Q70_14687 [Pomacea canaliculata]